MHLPWVTQLDLQSSAKVNLVNDMLGEVWIHIEHMWDEGRRQALLRGARTHLLPEKLDWVFVHGVPFVLEIF